MQWQVKGEMQNLLEYIYTTPEFEGLRYTMGKMQVSDCPHNLCNTRPNKKGKSCLVHMDYVNRNVPYI